jgi:hypothetical protein
VSVLALKRQELLDRVFWSRITILFDKLGRQESVTCEREGLGPDVTAAGGEVGMLGKSWDRLSQPRFWQVLICGLIPTATFGCHSETKLRRHDDVSSLGGFPASQHSRLLDSANFTRFSTRRNHGFHGCTRISKEFHGPSRPAWWMSVIYFTGIPQSVLLTKIKRPQCSGKCMLITPCGLQTQLSSGWVPSGIFVSWGGMRT